MSTLSYAPEQKAKANLRPSRQAIKRAALALAAALGVAAAADFGHHYWTTGRFLESTDDAYVQAELDDHRAEGLRLHRARCWSATTSRSRPARCWRGSTTAISGPRSTRRGRRRGGRGRDPQSRCAVRPAAVVIEQGKADVAAATADLNFAAGRADPLRRPDEDRRRHGAARAADRATLRASSAQLQRAKSALVAAERKVDVLATERAKAERSATAPARSSSRRS